MSEYQDENFQRLKEALEPYLLVTSVLPKAQYEEQVEMMLSGIRETFDAFRHQRLSELSEDLFDIRLDPEENP